MEKAKASDILADLFKSGRQFSYERGDSIIRAGDTPSGIYYLESGWVRVYTLCDNGESNIIMCLFPGEVFPLAWALTGLVRDASFAALAPTTLRRVSKEFFLTQLDKKPVFARAALAMLSTHLVRLTDELENLHFRSARERVAYRLLSLADHFGKPYQEGVLLTIRISNEYIARSTNMTRETASREIGRLTQKRLITNFNSYLFIHDPALLRAEAGKAFNLPLSVFN